MLTHNLSSDQDVQWKRFDDAEAVTQDLTIYRQKEYSKVYQQNTCDFTCKNLYSIRVANIGSREIFFKKSF